MILPGKHLRADRSLVAIGGEILSVLVQPLPVSETWEAVRRGRAGHRSAAPLTFDWFVLALTFLYTISAVRLEADRLVVERAR